MAANAGETKVKLWEGICYPENMRDDWQDEIDDILQVPFAYAVHDIDHDQKSLDTEKSKNAEMATLGKATYAMDQMLKSYEELMDIVASVGNFDKVAANKMMIEISKSMATVEKKCKKKLTA